MKANNHTVPDITKYGTVTTPTYQVNFPNLSQDKMINLEANRRRFNNNTTSLLIGTIIVLLLVVAIVWFYTKH